MYVVARRGAHEMGSVLLCGVGTAAVGLRRVVSPHQRLIEVDERQL